MLFNQYKAKFDARRAGLRFPPGTIQRGIGCSNKARPAMPPWVMDWAVLYPDGMHFRVKETYKPAPHPDFSHGERQHFCYQYGATTAQDAKGMPFTKSDADTVIRLDKDHFSTHMHYNYKAHIKQEALTGKFRIEDSEVFEFVEAVETHRSSGASFTDILFFELRKGRKR